MAPRGFTLPPATTQSARAARSAFFCALCQKGYSRQNEFEAHESSYDHQHKKRLKEMKEMQRAVVPAKKSDEKGGGPLMQIKIGRIGGGGGATGGTGGGGGFKKGGFKNAFAPVEDGGGSGGSGDVKGDVKKEVDEVDEDKVAVEEKVVPEDEDSDVTDQEDYYDPRKPTGCMPGCAGRAEASVG